MKKVVSLLLALAIAGSMSTMAFAAALTVSTTAPSDPSAYAGDASNGVLDFGNAAKPGDVMVAEMPTEGLFFDATNNVATTGLTSNEMSKGKVKFVTRVIKGSTVIDSIKLDYVKLHGDANKVATIKVELLDPWVSTNTDGQDFEAEAYVIVDGEKTWKTNALLSITGTIIPNGFDEDVDNDTGFLDIGDGTVFKPTEFVKSIELDVGNDISVFARALKGVKYYGVSTTDTTTADDDNVIKYDLDGVYHIKAMGLSTVANHVKLNAADASQYVYTPVDGGLKFVGKGNANLAYYDTYYLSAKELDTDTAEPSTDEEEGDSSDEASAPNPGTGADDNYPTNVNDNPGTGR